MSRHSAFAKRTALHSAVLGSLLLGAGGVAFAQVAQPGQVPMHSPDLMRSTPDDQPEIQPPDEDPAVEAADVDPRQQAGRTSRGAIGEVGERLSRQSIPHIRAYSRLATRLETRIDGRVENRIDRSYKSIEETIDEQDDAVQPER